MLKKEKESKIKDRTRLISVNVDSRGNSGRRVIPLAVMMMSSRKSLYGDDHDQVVVFDDDDDDKVLVCCRSPGNRGDSELSLGFEGTTESPADMARSFYFVMWAYGGWSVLHTLSHNPQGLSLLFCSLFL